jgi:hypothetical protein
MILIYFKHGSKCALKGLWDVVVQDTHVLAPMFAVAMDGLMDGWICSPCIVLDGLPRSHLHPQFLFYPVSIRRCGNVC